VLELDELRSFVPKKSQKRWIWIALCRRTRQAIAFEIGDRTVKLLAGNSGIRYRFLTNSVLPSATFDEPTYFYFRKRPIKVSAKKLTCPHMLSVGI
jgi:hypothetical protein